MNGIIDPQTYSKLLVLSVAGFVVVFAVMLARRLATAAITDNLARYRVRKFIFFLGVLAIAFITMSVFSERLTGVTVALGVAGAGIAFALQEVIASVAGWIAISVSKFYNVGDRVMMGGISGDVIDISMLRTTLMETGQWVNGDLYNGRIVRISNAFVFKEPVFNYSGDFPFLWDEIKIPVKYGSDRALAREILEKAGADLLAGYVEEVRGAWKNMVKNYMIEDAKLDPMVTMAATDNWIEYTLRYVVNYKKRRTYRDALFRRILDDFDATDGKVSMASATFHLVEAPEIKVRINR